MREFYCKLPPKLQYIVLDSNKNMYKDFRKEITIYDSSIKKKSQQDVEKVKLIVNKCMQNTSWLLYLP